MKEATKPKRNFFKYILDFFTLRKIQLDIVSVFVILISLFALFLILFTYAKNAKAIREISSLTMTKASDDLLDKIQGMTTTAALLTEVSQALVQVPGAISYQNKVLLHFLLDVLKNDTSIVATRFGSTNGDLVAAANISLSKETLSHVYNNPSKPLPTGAIYATRYVYHIKGIPTEVWQYLNKDFELLDEEIIHDTPYRVHNDPWFARTMEKQSLRWSNTDLNLIGESGLTVAAPAFDTSGEMTAVVAFNLSLPALSNFFLTQHVGSQGVSFILDKNGQIVLPPVKKLITLPEVKLLPMLTDIFKQFSTSGRSNFIFEKDQIKYLVFMAPFPLPLEETWTILFMVPFDTFFHSIVQTQRHIIFISIFATIVFGFFVYFSSKHIGNPIVKLASDVRKIQRFDFSESIQLKSQIIEIIELDRSINSMRHALRSFARYVPREIVQILIDQGKELAIGGEKKEVTVFFSDIADFTTFSEETPVEHLLEALTEYFEVFSNIILKSEGTIDKYIGDSVMGIWNAPQKVESHPDKACLSALRCLIASRKQQQAPGHPGWKTRFGLHTGEVIVGNIGTTERMNYTVIGDVVNTTARLHGVNKLFDTSIIISDSLQRKIDTQFLTRPLDTVSVKGKKHQITVYELVGLVKGEQECLATREQTELCHAFETAYRRFQDGKFEEAKEYFLNILKQFPEDKPTHIYLKKIQMLRR